MDKDFYMERCGIIITYRCNLKCKLCTAYSPYYEVPPHFEYEYLERAINKYFSMVTKVGKFTVSGGEPFLHKDLDRIIKCIMKFRDKVDVVEIITNGTITPKENLVSELIKGRDKIEVLIDDYGEELSIKVQDLIHIFTDNDIKYRVRGNNAKNLHAGGWIDFGDFLTKKFFTKEQIENQFFKCAIPQKMKFCFTIKGGEIHPCGPSYRCMELGIIPKNKDEFVDLFKDEDLDIKRGVIEKLKKTKSLTACAWCNGMCEDSKRFIPAEQIKKESNI